APSRVRCSCRRAWRDNLAKPRPVRLATPRRGRGIVLVQRKRFTASLAHTRVRAGLGECSPKPAHAHADASPRGRPRTRASSPTCSDLGVLTMDEDRLFYEDLHAGYAAGQAWAREKATPAQLARLAVRAADVQRPADPVSIFEALRETSRWRSVQ